VYGFAAFGILVKMEGIERFSARLAARDFGRYQPFGE
jgi:hypothetical protein